VGLPGYCFFLAVVLFVPAFIAVRLCTSLASLVFAGSAPGQLPSPLADELVLVALFSLLLTWSILFHQVMMMMVPLDDPNLNLKFSHMCGV
jgi:hypothetical protein